METYKDDEIQCFALRVSVSTDAEICVSAGGRVFWVPCIATRTMMVICSGCQLEEDKLKSEEVLERTPKPSKSENIQAYVHLTMVWTQLSPDT